jgi:glycosyltransferase involved in cell wall biosynthesis
MYDDGLRQGKRLLFMETAVTLVVPVYNAQDYLESCLRSIVRQSLRDIEIICINDGSTDRSLDILKKHAASDTRIKILDRDNSGYGASLNAGIAVAQGRYIGIVESDDFVDADMFQVLFDTAIQHDLEIVKSDYYEFDSQGTNKYCQVCRDSDHYNKAISAETVPQMFTFRMNIWTGLYHKGFLQKHNIRFNESPGASFQDNGFWFQTLALAQRVMFINQAFYHYRQDNPNSSINDMNKVFCMCDEYDYIEDFLERNPSIKARHIDTFIHKRYWNYMFSYERIAKEHKQLFLKRMSMDFSKHQKQVVLMDDKHVKDMVLRIIDDSDLFYYEDTLHRLKKLKEEKEALLKKIRSSNEMKRGKKITAFARKLMLRKV